MQNVNDTPTSYSLTDFYLASFLICKGLELIRADRIGPRRMCFVLKDSPLRDKLIQNFYSHKASIDPLEFKDAIMNLKALIHGLQAAEPYSHA